MSAEAYFRFLHLSDFHMGWPPNKYWMPERGGRHVFNTHDEFIVLAMRQRIKAIGAALKERRQEIDAVVLSGDIATIGRSRDLAIGESEIRAICNDLWPTLPSDEALRKVLIIPGNHDRFSDWRGTPGSAIFESVFGTPSDKRANRRKRFWQLRLYKGDSSLVLLGVDFSLASKKDATTYAGSLGQGHARAEIVEGLSEQTAHIKRGRVPTAVVWVMHFPPSNAGTKKAVQLRNAQSVASAAKKQRIPLILAGHIHTPRIIHLIKGTEAWIAGSATQFGERQGNSFHMIELRTSGWAIVEGRRRKYIFVGNVFKPEGTVDSLDVMNSR
jgi:DNA repair exonuclease SbcCD nuclease subunit